VVALLRQHGMPGGVAAAASPSAHDTATALGVAVCRVARTMAFTLERQLLPQPVQLPQPTPQLVLAVTRGDHRVDLTKARRGACVCVCRGAVSPAPTTRFGQQQLRESSSLSAPIMPPLLALGRPQLRPLLRLRVA
jgi:hypothetical protein